MRPAKCSSRPKREAATTDAPSPSPVSTTSKPMARAASAVASPTATTGRCATAASRVLAARTPLALVNSRASKPAGSGGDQSIGWISNNGVTTGSSPSPCARAAVASAPGCGRKISSLHDEANLAGIEARATPPNMTWEAPLILGIESSCDETAVALVAGDRTLLSHKLATQEAHHRPFGGVVPEIAARAHIEAVGPLVEAALDEAGVKLSESSLLQPPLDPGLIRRRPCRSDDREGVGLRRRQATDRGQSPRRTRALAPVSPSPLCSFLTCCCSFLEGIASCCWSKASANIDGWRRRSTMPLAKRSTRLLSCSASAFPEVRRSRRRRATAIPRRCRCRAPLKGSPEPHFSFAGLKSAVVRAVQAGTYRPEDIAASFQQAVIDCLIDRTARALDRVGDVRALVVAGGVAANQAIRTSLKNLAGRPRPAVRCAAPVAVHRQWRHDRLGGRGTFSPRPDRPARHHGPARDGRSIPPQKPRVARGVKA